MDPLGDLFGSRPEIPQAVTVDPAKEAQKASDYNTGQIGNFEKFAPGFTDFIKNLFNQTVNPQATQAQNTAYSLGNQLANNGSTDLMNNFFQYSRRIGLENAASTGAPLTSDFGQNLGSTIGVQNILKNQLTGLGILGQQQQNSQSLAQSFIQPSLGLFQQNLSSPGQFIQAATNNANTQNQFNLASAQADATASPFGNFLTSSFNTVLGAVAGAYSGGKFGGKAQNGSAGDTYSATTF